MSDPLTVIFVGHEPSDWLRQQIEDSNVHVMYYKLPKDIFDEYNDRFIVPNMLVIDFQTDHVEWLINYFQHPFYDDYNEPIPIILLLEDPNLLPPELHNKNIFIQQTISDSAVLNRINICWNKDFGQITNFNTDPNRN